MDNISMESQAIELSMINSVLLQEKGENILILT